MSAPPDMKQVLPAGLDRVWDIAQWTCYFKCRNKPTLAPAIWIKHMQIHLRQPEKRHAEGVKILQRNHDILFQYYALARYNPEHYGVSAADVMTIINQLRPFLTADETPSRQATPPLASRNLTPSTSSVDQGVSSVTLVLPPSVLPSKSPSSGRSQTSSIQWTLPERLPQGGTPKDSPTSPGRSHETSACVACVVSVEAADSTTSAVAVPPSSSVSTQVTTLGEKSPPSPPLSPCLKTPLFLPTPVLLNRSRSRSVRTAAPSMAVSDPEPTASPPLLDSSTTSVRPVPTLPPAAIDGVDLSAPGVIALSDSDKCADDVPQLPADQTATPVPAPSASAAAASTSRSTEKKVFRLRKAKLVSRVVTFRHENELGRVCAPEKVSSPVRPRFLVEIPLAPSMEVADTSVCELADVRVSPCLDLSEDVATAPLDGLTLQPITAVPSECAVSSDQTLLVLACTDTNSAPASVVHLTSPPTVTTHVPHQPTTMAAAATVEKKHPVQMPMLAAVYKRCTESVLPHTIKVEKTKQPVVIPTAIPDEDLVCFDSSDESDADIDVAEQPAVRSTGASSIRAAATMSDDELFLAEVLKQNPYFSEKEWLAIVNDPVFIAETEAYVAKFQRLTEGHCPDISAPGATFLELEIVPEIGDDDDDAYTVSFSKDVLMMYYTDSGVKFRCGICGDVADGEAAMQRHVVKDLLTSFQRPTGPAGVKRPVPVLPPPPPPPVPVPSTSREIASMSEWTSDGDWKRLDTANGQCLEEEDGSTTSKPSSSRSGFLLFQNMINDKIRAARKEGRKTEPVRPNIQWMEFSAEDKAHWDKKAERRLKLRQEILLEWGLGDYSTLSRSDVARVAKEISRRIAVANEETYLPQGATDERSAATTKRKSLTTTPSVAQPLKKRVRNTFNVKLEGRKFVAAALRQDGRDDARSKAAARARWAAMSLAEKEKWAKKGVKTVPRPVKKGERLDRPSGGGQDE